MKQILFLFLLIFIFKSGYAKDGYNIKVTFKQDISDAHIYLAHYFAKPMPTVYKTDSAKVINKRTAVFKNQDSVLGGMYLILFDGNSKYFEFILQNGDQFEINVDTLEMPSRNSFKNSLENNRYIDYQKKLKVLGSQQYDFMESLKSAKSSEDSLKIKEEMKRIPEEIKTYRKDYVSKYPNTYLTSVLKALISPETPKTPHYLEDGKTIDSTYAFYFYKHHYWDNFDFKDDRLIFSPVFDGKLNEYFNSLVTPIPDSMNYEADKLLAKIPKGSELFKYALYFLSKNAETSKVMGMDEAFVHLVENYYMKGDAFWLDSAGVAKYEERAKKIAPNVLGNPAPEMILQDIWTLEDKKLSDVNASFTLIVFWSPECGHCKTEIPLIDSVYNAALKQKGVKVFSVPTEGNLTEIQKTVEDFKIKDWINVVDVSNKRTYRDQYDVYGTPKVYLLDKNKKIVGKGLDHSNILSVLEWVEKKNEKKN